MYMEEIYLIAWNMTCNSWAESISIILEFTYGICKAQLQCFQNSSVVIKCYDEEISFIHNSLVSYQIFFLCFLSAKWSFLFCKRFYFIVSFVCFMGMILFISQRITIVVVLSVLHLHQVALDVFVFISSFHVEGFLKWKVIQYSLFMLKNGALKSCYEKKNW